MNKIKPHISRSDLKYYAGCALSGLSANPFLMSPDGKLHLTRHGKTVEDIATESALVMAEKVFCLELTLDKIDENEKQAQTGKEEENGSDKEPGSELN